MSFPPHTLFQIKPVQLILRRSSILTTEARQAAWLSAVPLHGSPWSGSFDVPLTANQVFSIVHGLIVSCPASNPPLIASPFPALTATVSGLTVCFFVLSLSLIPDHLANHRGSCLGNDYIHPPLLHRYLLPRALPRPEGHRRPHLIKREGDHHRGLPGNCLRCRRCTSPSFFGIIERPSDCFHLLQNSQTNTGDSATVAGVAVLSFPFDSQQQNFQ